MLAVVEFFEKCSTRFSFDFKIIFSSLYGTSKQIYLTLELALNKEILDKIYILSKENISQWDPLLSSEI